MIWRRSKSYRTLKKNKYDKLSRITKRQWGTKSDKKTWIMQLLLTAAFAGLVVVASMIVIFPIPKMAGYFGMGDAVIFVAALVFGPLVGGLAGGIGSAVADLVVNPLLVPYTLVIRGMEGWLVGRLSRRSFRSDYVACVLGGGEMVLGYFVVEVLLFGFGGALEDLPFNLFQVVAGIAVGPAIALLLRRILRSLSSQM